MWFGLFRVVRLARFEAAGELVELLSKSNIIKSGESGTACGTGVCSAVKELSAAVTSGLLGDDSSWRGVAAFCCLPAAGVVFFPG